MMAAASQRVFSPLVERGERGPARHATIKSVGPFLSTMHSTGFIVWTLSAAFAATRSRLLAVNMASLLAIAHSTSQDVALAARAAEAALAHVGSAGAQAPLVEIESTIGGGL